MDKNLQASALFFLGCTNTPGSQPSATSCNGANDKFIACPEQHFDCNTMSDPGEGPSKELKR